MNSIESLYSNIEIVWESHELSHAISACPFMKMDEQQMIAEATFVASLIRRSTRRVEFNDSSRRHLAGRQAEEIFGLRPEGVDDQIKVLYDTLIIVASDVLYQNEGIRRAGIHWTAQRTAVA